MREDPALRELPVIALSAGVLPFVIPDLVKAVLASLLALALYKVISRRNLNF